MTAVEAFLHRLNFLVSERKGAVTQAAATIKVQAAARGVRGSGDMLARERLAQETLDAALTEFMDAAEKAKAAGVGEDDVQRALRGAGVDLIHSMKATLTGPATDAFGSTYPARPQWFEHLMGRMESKLQDYRAGYLSPRASAPGASGLSVVVSHSPGAIVQQGQGNTQTVQVAIDTASATKSIDALVAELSGQVGSDLRVIEALDDLQAIRSQITRQTPNHTVLRELGRSTRSILEGAVGGMLTPAGLAAAAALWSALGLG
jgi:hypothetical protein